MIVFDQDLGLVLVIFGIGMSLIVVDMFDVVVIGLVSVIKMDFEGWEINVFCGVVCYIRESCLKLVIVVYYVVVDFCLVYQFVIVFGYDYECYLRYYMQGWFEIVMFFCNLCFLCIRKDDF